MKYWILCLISFCLFAETKGQDLQYSQFYANPVHLNPALTGAHSGTFRVMSGYRDQWRRALEAPFTMMTVAGDFSFPLKASGNFSSGYDHVAAGVVFSGQRLGIYDNNTNNLGISVAYHKLLAKESNHYLSVGFNFGLGLRSINYEDINFGDQFNGVNGYSEPTQEILPNNGVSYADVGLGLHYSIAPDKYRKYYLGISAFHLNNPNISYFDRDIRFPDEYEAHLLPSKFSAHGGAVLPIGQNTSLEPRVVVFSQDQHMSLTAGSSIRYLFKHSDNIALHLGAWIRSSRSLTTFQPTDAILTAGFEQNGLIIGFSYDANLRGLANFPGANVFELSISYIGNHENANGICPNF